MTVPNDHLLDNASDQATNAASGVPAGTTFPTITDAPFITLLRFSLPACKAFHLDKDGTLQKVAPDVQALYQGEVKAQTRRVETAGDLETMIRKMGPNDALCMGYWPGAAPPAGKEVGPVLTVLTEAAMLRKLKAAGYPPEKVAEVVEIKGVKYAARLARAMQFGNWMGLDFDDRDEMPAALRKLSVLKRLEKVGRLVPGITQAERVLVMSSSAQVLVDGMTTTSADNAHVYVRTSGDHDFIRQQYAKIKAALLADDELGFMVDRGSAQNPNAKAPWSVVDPSTFSPERPWYEAPAAIEGKHGGRLSLDDRQIEKFETAGDDTDVQVLSLEHIHEPDQAALDEFGNTTGYHFGRRKTGSLTLHLDNRDLLTMDTEFVTEAGTITLREFWESGQQKLRSDTPFRLSNSDTNGTLNRDRNGGPVHFDNGSQTRYWLHGDELEEVQQFLARQRFEETAPAETVVEAAKAALGDNSTPTPASPAGGPENAPGVDDSLTQGAKTGRTMVEPVDLWDTFPPPPFLDGVLPKIIENFSKLNAAQMGADPAGFALGALVTCAAALPDHVRVRPKLHDPRTEAARLWGAGVGGPSTKKTPIFEMCMAPLKRFDMELFRSWQRHKDRFDAMTKDEREESGETEPPQVRKCLGDTTVEAAQAVLAVSHDGVMLFQDELSSFFGNMDRYAGGNKASADRPFWLQAYNGHAYTVNRVRRGALYIPNLSVCVLGGIQPDPLRRIIQGASDDGLIQRLIPVTLAPAGVGQDLPMPSVNSRYDLLIRRLLSMQLPQGTKHIMLSAGARDVRTRLEAKCANLQHLEAISVKLSAHIGKYEGYFCRLCLLFHVVDYVDQELDKVTDDDLLAALDALEALTPDDQADPETPVSDDSSADPDAPTPADDQADGAGDDDGDHLLAPGTGPAYFYTVISQATAERVEKFVWEFMFPHALAFYGGTLGLSEDQDIIVDIAGYILAHGKTRMTLRDMGRGSNRMKKLDKYSVGSVMGQLEALAWVQADEIEAPGRSQTWTVNPLVHDRFQARAQSEAERRQEIQDIIKDALKSDLEALSPMSLTRVKQTCVSR